mmetsp:Transcript_78982/g.209742  ORF Transcript_78982/g.209742 Transcript_78982/m.209742 type:complete len:216 (-) Transcript_78982:45-692(-)
MRLDHLVNGINIGKLDEREATRSAVWKPLDVHMLHLPELGKVRADAVLLGRLPEASHEDHVRVVLLLPPHQLLVLGQLGFPGAARGWRGRSRCRRRRLAHHARHLLHHLAVHVVHLLHGLRRARRHASRHPSLHAGLDRHVHHGHHHGLHHRLLLLHHVAHLALWHHLALRHHPACGHHPWRGNRHDSPGVHLADAAKVSLKMWPDLLNELALAA